jgi:hypothetical protein
MIERPALPPIRIFFGEVACEFIAAYAFGLSDAIGRQEASLAVLNPSAEELQMSGI